MMKLGWVLGLAISIAATTTAAAQTISYAQAVDRLAAACGTDIEKYCKGVNLGNGRIRNCLAQNQAKVSGRCNVEQVEVFRLIEKRAAAQVAVISLCDADARRLCAGVQFGDGNILSCLLTAQRAVSAKCNQAITDSGYR